MLLYLDVHTQATAQSCKPAPSKGGEISPNMNMSACLQSGLSGLSFIFMKATNLLRTHVRHPQRILLLPPPHMLPHVLHLLPRHRLQKIVLSSSTYTLKDCLCPLIC